MCDAMKEVKSFYKSKKWKLKRIVTLKRDDFLCRESKQFGKTKPADTVHHIFPLEQYPELALENWNLISLNNAVHNTFHDRVTNKIIGRGIVWQKKRRREFEKFYGYPPPIP